MFKIPITDTAQSIASGKKVLLTFGVDNPIAWELAPDYSTPKTFDLPFSDKKIVIHSTVKDKINMKYRLTIEVQG
jgi:hypothetical protein